MRRISRLVMVGGVPVGGGAPVTVQSMTNTPTRDVRATTRQINRLAAGGADLVRVSVPDDESAAALGALVASSPVPLVADIHFRADLALRAVEAGVAKLRLNPGNIRRRRDILEVAGRAFEAGIPIRIGINSGSLPGDLRERYGGVNPDSMWAAAERHLSILREAEFENVVLSFKASSALLTVAANEKAAAECDLPLHIGVTEAGPSVIGAARNAVAASILLSKGIGDTLRVSLSGPPEDEVPVALEILSSLGLRGGVPRLVSCPTCARCRIDVGRLSEMVMKKLRGVQGDFTVAVMGCEVNGPGEAREADLAVTGSPSGIIFFRRGRRLPGRVAASDLAQRLERELAALAANSGGRS
ncbi:flavodoxin-dependent (E)-4-hydroxy-3-methylbut-2-enyl-diphosphate synthase [Candidatus Fermentibacteria bacterium]|nr:flavodoxin-dependent (E)-4-hydroxy-3-methylbut-2-enyl-diphosphate synthase [Candidatus Fermentibacteria bacterium]